MRSELHRATQRLYRPRSTTGSTRLRSVTLMAAWIGRCSGTALNSLSSFDVIDEVFGLFREAGLHVTMRVR